MVKLLIIIRPTHCQAKYIFQHDPCQPLRPVIALRFSLSFTSWTTSASTPIYHIRPPPCRSSLGSVAFHHLQQHSLDQSVVIHSADLAENVKFSLLYQVHHGEVFLYFFSNGLVTDFVFPADVQYSPTSS